MLFYKAWRESWIRFLLGLLFLCGVSAAAVLYFGVSHRQVREGDAQPLEYGRYIWGIIFKGGNSLREAFMLITLFLGMGGLLRERAHGSAAFSLALPVPRWRFVAARGLVGLSEVGVLSFAPGVIVLALSPAVGQSYPPAQLIQFAALWWFCGAVVFAGAFLCSVLVEGEYASPASALVALALYSWIVALPLFGEYPLNTLDIHKVMSGEGMPYFSRGLARITGLPWVTLVCASAVAAGLLVLSAYLTRKQDF